MKKWKVINQNDGNEVFEVEGETYKEAASNALVQLGWALCTPYEKDEDNGEDEAAIRTEDRK